ncbi:MAG: ribosomal-processing cysteine protease Prp [Clostridia bacterium]|nr:ribosomal-processing cysteine protease Prp [Clostridia bacterium]
MIKVYATKQGEKYRLLVQGHATKGQEEGSLVCAAVSALTGALVSFATSHPACRYVRASLSRGNAFLSCRSGLNEAYDMTVLALRQLALEHPMHVCFPCGGTLVNDTEALPVL